MHKILGKMHPIKMYEYARALSLDIRADVLSRELLELETSGSLSDETIESWLYSDGFTQQVIRQQQALVWNNLSVQIARNRDCESKWIFIQSYSL